MAHRTACRAEYRAVEPLPPKSLSVNAVTGLHHSVKKIQTHRFAFCSAVMHAHGLHGPGVSGGAPRRKSPHEGETDIVFLMPWFCFECFSCGSWREHQRPARTARSRAKEGCRSAPQQQVRCLIFAAASPRSSSRPDDRACHLLVLLASLNPSLACPPPPVAAGLVWRLRPAIRRPLPHAAATLTERCACVTCSLPTRCHVGSRPHIDSTRLFASA
jgi:hypothetical protein